MTTSENQVRHLYVSGDNANTITVGTAPSGETYLKVANSDSKLSLRSDLIKKANLIYAKGTKAAAMSRKLAVKQIVPASVTAGYDYFIRVAFRQYIGQTDADTYAKYATAHAATGAAVKNVLAELAVSLAKNLAPEAAELLTVKLLVTAGSLTSAVTVTKNTKLASLTGDYKALAVCEVEQPWVLGTMESTPLYFELSGNESGQNASGANVYESWGTVTDVTASLGTTVVNSKKTADLEYFLLGERGDQYRGMGFPNNVATKGYVNGANASGYDYIDLHYFTNESGMDCQKSEKTITVVGVAGTLSTLATAIDTALGTTLATDLT